MKATFSTKNGRTFKKPKGGTPSTRKHRFESFNQRVAKLKIDPARRARRQIVDQDDVSSTLSYFKASLDSWKDLNLSENFTAFVKEVEPFCNNLVEVLYHQQKIMDIMVDHLDKGDILSWEPLLSLMSHLAHDLGARFEIHFSRATTLITTLAAKAAHAEVVEWSFMCLAWLFKYLSRLLVPDLRPVFDIMVPLLGIETHKPHVVRFAGEAMSFLVRKAATVFSSRKEPLELLLNHIKNDIEARGAQDISLYQEGLMTLLADSMKGTDMALHSRADCVYKCLLNLLEHDDNPPHPAFTDVIFGVTVNLIHHCNGETFQPILDAICSCVSEAVGFSQILPVYGHLLFIMVAVRKGSRIQDWGKICDSIVLLLQITRARELPAKSSGFESIYKALAVAFQYAPLDVITPRLRSAMNQMMAEPNASMFLPFCTYFSDIDKDRFKNLLLPFFLK